jgi:hypothetical protein
MMFLGVRQTYTISNVWKSRICKQVLQKSKTLKANTMMHLHNQQGIWLRQGRVHATFHCLRAAAVSGQM